MKKEKTNMLYSISEENNGIITTKSLEAHGISRVHIPALIKEGLLVKEAHGIYYCANEFPDELRILQERSKKIIFSYATALFLWGLADRVPHIIDITVPQGYNTKRLQNANSKLRFHYVNRNKLDIGISETKTTNGNLVKLYDRERCIIDVVKAKEKIEKQLYLQSLKEYFSSPEADTAKLIKYSKLFNIENQIRSYMEILS